MEQTLPQSIRYQVFLSSTFTDLKEERAEVLQALWELDCIPTGMEAFLATNESQWEVIQKVIDECDYYVLIIGGRYGSVTPEGISYTEKEYNYAKSRGIPILGFIHGDPDSIPVGKVDKEESGRLRLQTFRNRVMAEYPIRTWQSSQELGGLVSRSVSKAIKVNPQRGWIRNEGTSSVELLQQINALTKENQELKDKARSQVGFPINVDELESGSDEIDIEGVARIHNKGDKFRGRTSVRWSASASWDDIFRDVGPILMNEATEDRIKEILARFISWSDDIDRAEKATESHSITHESFAEILVQLRALGLIERGSRKRAVSDHGSYWALTEYGERYLTGLLARKKGKAPKALPTEETGPTT